MTTIHNGTMLFHAADIPIERPIATYCNDTGKTGMYFACNNVYLAETMCLEYMQNLTISRYILEADVNVSVGKYSFTRGYTKYPTTGWDKIDPEDNISHYDDTLWPIDLNVISLGHHADYRHSELFLVEADLQHVRYLDCYTMTVGECVRKWYKQSWFEDMVDNYMRQQWSPGHNSHACRKRPGVNDHVPYIPSREYDNVSDDDWSVNDDCESSG